MGEQQDGEGGDGCRAGRGAKVERWGAGGRGGVQRNTHGYMAMVVSLV